MSVPAQQEPSLWCFSRGKRACDVVMAALLLIATAPLLLVVAAAVRLTSTGPVLFRQWRLGQNGRPFQLLKFRTMRHEQFPTGLPLTRGGDSRVTATGKWLRGWKLDELPQLINVLKGEMSLVGPRPDLQPFWEQMEAPHRNALLVKPGITGAASLVFRDEETLLARVPAAEVADFYLSRLLPQKAAIDLEYAAHATFAGDCRLLAKTVLAILRPGSSPELAPHEQVPR